VPPLPLIPARAVGTNATVAALALAAVTGVPPENVMVGVPV